MLSKKELAQELNVSQMTINRLMAKGLPYIKVGKQVRFVLEEVIEWLKERK